MGMSEIIEKVGEPEPKPAVDMYRAVGLAEGFETGSAAEVQAAWKFLIESGQVWNLQGWFGRTAVDLMAQGVLDVDMSKVPDAIANEVEKAKRDLSLSGFMN